jgi:ribonuclease J
LATITVYDGARTIGGTKIFLEADETRLFLDFGLNFKKYGLYFEEFLKPRTARGIYDLLTLGLAPALAGIYRDDIFPEDIDKLAGKPLDIQAIFLSHAHLDHCGLVGLLDPEIPVFCSAMTAVITKSLQDTGKASFETEIVYFSPKNYIEKSSRALRSNGRKYCVRRFYIVDKADLSEINKEFWQECFKSKKFQSLPLQQASGRVGNLSFQALPVDHSIYGAMAYAFETSSGWVVYTGDFRLHGSQSESQEFIERLSTLPITLLIVEGTNVDKKSIVSEGEVYENCLRAVQKVGGKIVIADFSPRNIERLQVFLRIAKATNRRLVITAKDAFLLFSMRLVDAGIPDLISESDLLIFQEVRGRNRLWESNFVEKKFGQKYIKAQEIKRSPGEYILCFSFWDLNNLLDIRPNGGIYIYSTSEAFTEEQEIDVWRLSNWLDFFAIKPVGFSLPEHAELGKLGRPEFIEGYHSSGHISGPELFTMIREIKPEKVMPVHTEKPELFVEELKDVEVLLPREGESISF